MAVKLTFNSIEDFEPAKVVQQVEPLRKLLETRNKLRDLMTKVDVSEDLESVLEDVLENTDQLEKFRRNSGLPTAASKPWQLGEGVNHEHRQRKSPSPGRPSRRRRAVCSIRSCRSRRRPNRITPRTWSRPWSTSSPRGRCVYDKDVTRTIKNGIAEIDATISKQLAAIMHAPEFQQMEGTWRGLHHLVMNSETGTELKIKMLNVSKQALFKDVDRAVEFDQSQIFKKLYENEFGSPGGEPYGALIGDYEFTNHPEDVDLLGKMSNVAAAAFCPFISAASPKLLGLDSFTDLAKPRDLAKIFDTVEYTQWRSFRDSEDSRFVTLTMPRVLSRLPYGANTKPIDEFAFEEVELDRKGKAKPVPHDHYSWMNAAYVLGTRLTDAFAKTGFCTAIRGAEGGGKVEGLPAHVFTSDDGDPDLKCPTEIGITDRREAELSKLGFLPLCHYKNTDYAVFFGAQIDAEAEEVRPGGRDGQRGHFGPAAVHHGHVAVRALPEGDRPRQDRPVHGSRAIARTSWSVGSPSTSAPIRSRRRR